MSPGLVVAILSPFPYIGRVAVTRSFGGESLEISTRYLAGSPVVLVNAAGAVSCWAKRGWESETRRPRYNVRAAPVVVLLDIFAPQMQG
jgi:hypothetical protein